MKIVQLLPTMAFGDAVSNDAAAIDRMLSDMGYKTELYASNVDPRLPAGTAAHWKKMKDLHDEDLLIFHASTGDPLNRKVPSFGGRKMMIYHNITPSSFFRGYSRAAEELTETGRRQIRRLSDQFRYCVADSDYNRFELRQMGYQCPIDVCPIIIPFEDYEKEPDRKVIGKYKDDGWTNLLFVGRIAPNKKQEDVTPEFQKLMAALREKYGSTDNIPQEVRDEVRRHSLPLMKWNGLLTFNFRESWLFLFCLLDFPVGNFLWEIIGMGILYWYVNHRHETFCKRIAAKL